MKVCAVSVAVVSLLVAAAQGAAPTGVTPPRVVRTPAATLPLRPLPVQPTTPAASADSGDAEAFINSAKTLKEHLVWTAGDGKKVSFDNWTAAQKARLELFFKKYENNERTLTLKLTTEDKIRSNGGFYYTADVAFDIYAAQAAHVLYVEDKHLVPWSIASRPGAELDELLASSAYFARIGPSQGNSYPNGIQPGRDFTDPPENDGLGELISDPRIAYDFVTGKTSASHKTLVGKDELETLANLSVWLRDNVTHGPLQADDQAEAKLQRYLDKRLQHSPGSKTAMAISGCHSTSKLLVDLARSINLPLLHVRSLDNNDGDAASNYLNRTHGALVYGWGGRTPRVLWHTDNLNAMSEDTCFPLTAQGTLAGPEQFKQIFFDTMWVSPETLIKHGLNYKLEVVYPGKGYGHNDRGQYEDRLDYGYCIGAWKKKGTSDLSSLYVQEYDYDLCSAYLMQLQGNSVLDAQFTSDDQSYFGSLAKADIPAIIPMAEFTARATAGLKAIGGADKLAKLSKDYENSRGSNLMVTGAALRTANAP